MSGQTSERAFETHVEETLLGPSGWQSGTNSEWDIERALFPVRICTFLAETQPRLWSDMRTLHGDGLGFHGTGPVLTGLMRAGDLQGMAATVTDEMLDAFALVAKWDDMADALIARYAGVAERVVPYLALDDIHRAPSGLGHWGEIARAVRAG